jgi:HEAT repeat protein
MLLSLALSLFAQNPTFHWDKSVDEKYWQALHLLEVDEVPGEAASLLQELIDEPSVLQFRGQAGFLLAQAYRALLACGRPESAAALLPTIRREIAGTEYEVVANSIMNRALQSASEVEELDPDFMEWVSSNLIANSNQRAGAQARAQAYGKRIVPYLLAVIEDGQAEDSKYIANAFGIGANMGEAEFFHHCLELIQDRDGKFANDLFQYSGVFSPTEESVPDELLNFFIEVSKDSRILVSSFPIRWILYASAYNKSALNRILEILSQDEEVKAQYITEILLTAGFPGASKVVVAISESTNPKMTAMARKVAFQQRRHLVALDHFSQKGDLEATKILLSRLSRKDSSNYGRFDFVSPWSGEKVQLGPSALGPWAPAWLSQEKVEIRSSEYLQRWQPVIARLIQDHDEEIVQAACIVALQNEDWPTVLDYLAAHEAPASLAFILPDRFPPDFDPYLEGAIDHTEAGWIAADRLVRQSRSFGFPAFAALLKEPAMEQQLWIAMKRWPRNEQSMEWTERVALEVEALPALRIRAFDLAFKYGAYPSEALLNGLCAMSLNEHDFEQVLRRWWFETLKKRLEAELMVKLTLSSDSIRTLQAYLSMAQRYDWQSNPIPKQWMSSVWTFMHPWQRDGVDFDPVFLPLFTSKEKIEFWDQAPSVRLVNSPQTVAVAMKLAPDIFLKWDKARYAQTQPLAKIALLGHPNPEVRDALFLGWGLGIAIEPQAEINRVLEQAIAELSNPVVASNAASTLVRYSVDQDFIPKLIQAWELPNLQDRSTLMGAINGIYDERLLPVLMDAIRSQESRVSGLARGALDKYLDIGQKQRAIRSWVRAGQQGTPVDHLIEQLQNSNLEIRLAAIESLGTLQAKEALAFLVDLLAADEEQIAVAAATALRRINRADSTAAVAESRSGE